MGLATAYNLARMGAGRIVIVDRSYLCSGASGRNGGGVRAQFSSETNIELMKRSLELCDDFATEMGINVWLRRDGYLFLARNAKRRAELEASVALQRSHGLPTRMIGPSEILSIVPEIDVSGIEAGSYNPDDAVVFPWPFVWGYARACQRLGVTVHPFVDAELEATGGAMSGALLRSQRVESLGQEKHIRAPLVILATGAWSPEVAAPLGLELPNHPHRHEICSTEPLKPFLGPLVADLESGLYFSQSMRGEIVGGVSNARVPPGVDQRSSLRFLGLYAKALTRTMPILGSVRVLRQWAGCYDLTPDGSPIIGRVDSLEGLILLCGFMGHGFMIAPIIGLLTARYLLKNEERELFHRWSLGRFERGELLPESMILG
ncbi:MAG: FAD-binding oxidoreductase [Deltaproteobacteria bacterium]|nr:FAD-binding oxidoreductase [Deltaproteobacteria bacterium]